MLEYILYGILLMGPMTGYEIKRFMTMSTALFYDASFGSIYPMLQRLEKKGTLSALDSVGEGRFKRRYSITDLGRAEFDQWIRRPIPFHRCETDFLVPIFFYGRIPPEDAVRLIRDFMGAVRAELAAVEEVEPMVRPVAGRFEIATLQYGLDYYRFLLRWCEERIAEIQGAEKENSC